MHWASNLGKGHEKYIENISEAIFEKWYFRRPGLSWLTNSVAPEPEGSSPHSQQAANGSHAEPGESTPHTPNQSL
jgi:hypothetical protein